MTSEEYSYELKIPKDRIAVLIGKNGDVKKAIEENTKTKLQIDSKEGDVIISGNDAINLFTTREIIKAIARGFNPELAQQLLKTDYVLETISMNDYAGKSKDAAQRLKGRVIGKEGKTRTIIEELTDTNVSVYGKTISIIGLPENTSIARKAVENLLKGSQHSNVYRWLEKRRSINNMQELDKP